MTTEEAIKRAERAAALLSEAADMMHDIALADGFSKTVQRRAYNADKAIRDASMVIVCNFAGLIDTLKREPAE